MRILFLAHLFPIPADSGGKIKSLCTIRALASRHTVRVLAYVRNEAERASTSELAKMCDGVDIVPFHRSRAGDATCALASILLGRSYIVTRDFRREMLERLRGIIREFKPDVLHVDHLQMAQFVDSDRTCSVVLDEHNVEYLIVKRISQTSSSSLVRAYARLEWPKLKTFESEACRKADLVLAVSDQDAEEIRRLSTSDKRSRTYDRCPAVETVPIGVDTASISPVKRNPDSKNILFLGTMYWPPNIDCVLYFYREILPIVRQTIPDCSFTIAGQRPPRIIKELERDPNVRVTGYVADPREAAANCGVFVVPLRSGSGVRVKILDALAMGLPVVSTSIGAEGLAVNSGEHLLIADDPEEFAEAVVKVLTDKNLAEALGSQGRTLVQCEYSWEVVGQQLLDVYDKHLGSQGQN
ncbi:MAG: glycosyltransferase family 4 protein [Armatimonadota bacterium]|nr:glycosyltransferase family 4 protein [Armatimonadota bacterium]